MSPLLEGALRRLESAFDRRRFQRVWERLRIAGLAVSVSILIPLAVPYIAEWIRFRVGPRDADVLLWWPVSESHAVWPILSGVLVGVVFGIGALARGNAALRRAKWAWLALALLAVTSALLSLDASVRIHADRMVVARGAATEAVRPGTYFLGSADQVEARCVWISRRRDPDYATVDYWVHLPAVGWIALGDTRPAGRDAAREWFRTLASMDEKAFGHAPHVAIEDGGVRCIRALRAELGDEGFEDARRMMGLSEADFARYYAEPHEAWRRKASDGS